MQRAISSSSGAASRRLRAAAALEGAGDVLDPDEGGAAARQHRLRAGRDRRGGGPRRHARRCTLADTLAAGDGLCDERAVARAGRRRSALRPRADGLGRRVRSRSRRRARARRSKAAHSARRVLHARDATGREIGRALWERVVADCQRPRRTLTRARSSLIVEDGRCAGVEFLQDDGTRARGAGAVHAAGDRRRRAGLQRDDEPAGRDRRRRGDGVPRRGARRRPRVRAVPPDGARRCRGSRASCCRRRCAAKGRGWSTRRARRSWPATIRPAISRRAIAWRAAIVREAQRTGGAGLPVARSARSGVRARAVSADLGGLPARRPRPRDAIGSRSAPRRTT